MATALHAHTTNSYSYVVANFEGSGEKRTTGKVVKINRTQKTGLMLLNLIFHLGIRSLYKKYTSYLYGAADFGYSKHMSHN